MNGRFFSKSVRFFIYTLLVLKDNERQQENRTEQR